MSQRALLVTANNPQLEQRIVLLLRQAGYWVLTAHTPDGAADQALRCRPHLVLIGDGPHGRFASGWRVAHWLRVSHPAVPLVMVTANHSALLEIGSSPRGAWFGAGFCSQGSTAELEQRLARCVGTATASPPHPAEAGPTTPPARMTGGSRQY
jgi:hypothetical protein